MKKSYFYYMFALICSTCMFTACGDDDDDDVTVESGSATSSLTVTDIVGTYDGDMDISIAGTTMFEDQSTTIYVEEEDESTVTISLYDFTLAGYLTDGLDIQAECTATLSDDEYVLNGTTTVEISGNEMSVVVSGEADGDELDLDITITYNSIVVEFEGTKTSSDVVIPTIDITDIVGTYDGDMDISIATVTMFEDQATTIYVEEVDENTVTVSLYDFTLAGYLTDGLDIQAECTATLSDDEYTLSGTTTVEISGNELEVTVSGEADGDELDLDITINYNNIVVDFDGTKTSSEVIIPTLSISDIVGTYDGDMDIYAQGLQIVDGQTTSIIVSSLDEDSVTIALYDFTIAGVLTDAVDIEANCSATLSDDEEAYSLSGTTTVEILGMELEVTVSGEADEDDLDLDITINYNNIVVEFEGTK